MPAPCGMALIHKAALHGSSGQGPFNFRGNIGGNVGGTFPLRLPALCLLCLLEI